MSAFLNLYRHDDTSIYTGLVDTNNASVIHALGNAGDRGVLAKISDQGNVIWSRYYSIDGQEIEIHNGVECPNGDFMLYGSEVISRNQNRSLIIRVSDTGKVIWSNVYYQERTRRNIKLIHLGNNVYVFASWYRVQGQRDDLELVKISGEGTIGRAINVGMATDEQGFDIIPYNGGCVVVGGTDAQQNYGNFIIGFDAELNVLWSRLLGDNQYQEAKRVIALGNDDFVLAGETRQARDSYLLQFNINDTSTVATYFNTVQGRDSGRKSLVKDASNYYLVSSRDNNNSSRVTKLDLNFGIVWHKELNINNYQISQVQIPSGDPNTLRFSGRVRNQGNHAMLIASDLDMVLCSDEELSPPNERTRVFSIENWSPTVTEVAITGEKRDILAEVKFPMKEELCPDSSLDLSGETLVQSPYIYLQAAGSDGADGTVRGNHLRWDFRKELADKHIAKGSLSGTNGPFPATYDFNKDDDFIKVYRTLFTENFYTEIDFNNPPTNIITNANDRVWEYDNIIPVAADPANINKVVITFTDAAAYDANPFDPTTDTLNFISQYNALMLVRVDGKLVFRVEWAMLAVDPGNLATAQVRYETVSLEDSTDATSQKLTCRRILTDDNSNRFPFVVCEDMEQVRFDYFNAFPETMRFYAYDDYLLGKNLQSSWTKLGDFALTVDQGEAYLRLEDTARYALDQQWPKYNDDDAVTGAFKVSVPNYQNRWSMSDGLQFGVGKYVILSQDQSPNPQNPNATETVQATPIGNLPDTSSTEVSYFDLLNIVSFDYHVARMLGLGYIDADRQLRPRREWVYLMEYDTEGDLQDGGGARDVKHIYMTPHQGIFDTKLPPIPMLEDPVTYGVVVDNATANASALTDSQGYTAFADSRFINLNRDPFRYELPFEDFFQTSDEFHLCDETVPVTFGVEYRLDSEANYRRPELNQDQLYFDNSGLPEVLAIPNSETNPVYRHQETEEGIHCYGLYSINWFSRVSPVSDPVCTDFTRFPKRNTLLPPSNLGVQLVQPELPPILTTPAEQQAYSLLPGDKTYLRVQFDYNYVHHQAYQFADKAEFFFHKQEKRSERGEIVAVTQLSGNRVQVTTTSYDILSTNPMETVTPTITTADAGQFAGSLFASGGKNFTVEQVVNNPNPGGEDPTFILEMIRETNSVENPVGSNVWTTTETYVAPTVGDKFFVSENLGDGGNWDNKLARTVYLERFSTNDEVIVSGSTANNGTFVIDAVNVIGVNTEVVVRGNINDNVVDGNLIYDRIMRVHGFTAGNDGFLIEGDVTAELPTIGGTITIFGSHDNDGDYTIASAANFNGVDTEVVVIESINLNSAPACLAFDKIHPVIGYSTVNSTITVAGDISAELIPSYKEVRTNDDGSTTELVIGGLVAQASVSQEPDVYDVDNAPTGINPGTVIPGSKTGVYTITFTGNPLGSHIDPEVRYFRGKIRILEDATFLPTPLDSRTTPEMKVLDVWRLDDTGPNLEIIAYDSTFEVDSNYDPVGEYVPIVTNISTTVNVHPSYLLYLTVDENPITGGGNNEFNEATMLPATGEGTRKTFLGVRSVDSTFNDPVLDDCASYVPNPATIVAQEITFPEPPNEPSGPLYATRPDFFGKSTYTFDTSFNNTPYSVVFYKANERKILDKLYLPATVEQILLDMESQITQPDVWFTDRWYDLVNVSLDTNPGPDLGKFKAYGADPFRFPIPDNPDFIILQTITEASPIAPFDGVTVPGAPVQFTLPDLSQMSMEAAVRQAIASAFTSITEAPMIYEFIKTGEQTRTDKPRLRDDNDDLIPPLTGTPAQLALYDPTPFAVRLTGGNVRFTDYNIDGGSDAIYFYYGVEISDKQIKSDPSSILGPIQLVNTSPAEPPKIREVITNVEDLANGITSSVSFDITEYIQSEGIKRVDIYRANNAIDALTVRTMDLAKEVSINLGTGGTDYLDDFEGLPYPLYGDDLHYRLVAMREITLEDGITTEFIPSKQSKLVTAVLADPNNPPAPCLVAENGVTTPTELQNVILKWDQVGYNITYRLQKLNEDGNWEEIYEIKSNDAQMQYPPIVGGLPDFTNFDATAVLPREDADGNPVYHRFRVQVENSSGLLNLDDCPITLATGCFDLSALDPFIEYTDLHGFNQPQLTSGEVDDGMNNNPGQMTFDFNVQSILPAGHNTFDRIEIAVIDDEGNRASQTVLSPTGQAVFMDGDGDETGDALLLDEANHSYSIRVKVFTDLCTDGYTEVFNLNYVQGPCNDLSKVTEILSLTDSTHTLPVLESTSINNGTSEPVFITLTDIADVSVTGVNQGYICTEITFRDSLGNDVTKIITTEGGSVTFTDGEGDETGEALVLNDANLSREFTIEAVLKTDECPEGVLHTYVIDYTYYPCVELEELTDIISYADSNGANVSPLIDTDIDNGFDNPGGSIVIGDIVSGALPLGHTFVSMEVTLGDGQGGVYTQSVAAGGTATFNTGDGDETGVMLELDATNPNATYAVTVNLVTDKCPGGAFFSYILQYTYDPCVEISNLTDIVNYQDGNGFVIAPLVAGDFDDGTSDNPGGSMTFTDVVSPNLPLGDSLTSIEVTVDDGSGETGSTDTGLITTPGGNVTLTGVDLATPNRTYTISVKVVTTLCPDGVMFVYAGRYVNGL